MKENKATQNSYQHKSHEAKKPTEIPGKAWVGLFKRVANNIKDDNVQIVAAGIAFYFFLALFPAIAAIVSIAGLVIEPAQVEEQMGQIAQVLPDQAYEMISNILRRTAQKSEDTLGWSLAVSILLSLWSANKATTAVFEGVNIAYNEKDDRGFIKKKALTLFFTLGAIVIGILSVAFVVGFPVLIDKLGLPSILEIIFSILRWIVLAIIIYLVLAFTYKMAPDRRSPKFKWVSWGAALATVFWLAGSLLFTFYVNNFGSYDQTYGSIAAVIILLLWFFLTGFIVIIGAEINAETENQTTKDTTVGKSMPMGLRKAYFADHVVNKNDTKH